MLFFSHCLEKNVLSEEIRGLFFDVGTLPAYLFIFYVYFIRCHGRETSKFVEPCDVNLK